MDYPLRFGTPGGEVDGYGLGAVSTVPEARGRGYASALCRHVIEHAEAGGRGVGLLFSAIPPAMYERLGFRVRPAWDHVAERLADLMASGPVAALEPLDGHAEADTLAALWAAHHDGLYLVRDAPSMRLSLDRYAYDFVLGVGRPRRGYVRVEVPPTGAVEILEWIVPPALDGAALRAVAAVAERLGRGALRGWLAPTPTVRTWFRDRGRADTLPMVRGAGHVEDARFQASDYF
jgi:hypothetical protein